MSTLTPFMSHLIELRTRIIYIATVFIVTFFALMPWAKNLYTLLSAPLLSALPDGGMMIATEVTSPFFVPVKLTLMTAFVISLPWTLYQVWAFVAPGLYKKEQRLIVPLLISSLLLFFLGTIFAYFVVFPVVFGFVSGFTPEGVAMMTDIDKYLSFCLGLFLAFGLAFETPIVVILLIKTGIVSIENIIKARPFVIVGAFVAGAIFTPPDVISQFLLALPLWFLYETGIIFSRIAFKQPAEIVEPHNDTGE